jgi:very-short-patch-repair endonuclease
LVKKKNEYLKRIFETAPILADGLRKREERNLWIGRLKNIEKVWQWKRAKAWLKEYSNENTESLERRRKEIGEEIQRFLALLSSLRAWEFCMSRMKEEDRRHLIAWKQAITKLGKGTGKYAYTHRQDAQYHLNECRGAVPAWIMPLHKVFETVDAGPGIFDVVIVDEASQCGLESLALIYLAKKIIVVGDDKQISPEVVGVDRQQTLRLMHDYLSEFEHSSSFDIEKSLFDHASLRFANRIPLREHFRCMPEIIRFSNDLCYQSNPLIPLRQYSLDRLEPIKTVLVNNGYREGESQRVINRPEAEKLVEAIIKCCSDKKYEGMSMGVIALQGEAQAELISSMLMKNLGAEEMEERRLLCGNPYTFQGDERDVMFLSMVAAPNVRIGALTKETDQRRFNVAASRARDQVWLFHSVTSNHLSKECFRRRMLEYYTIGKERDNQALGIDVDALTKRAHEANKAIEKAPTPFDSWFEVDVALRIANRGYRIIPQYEIADKKIDIVVQGSQASVAVECDGDHWHGQEKYADDMERQRKLERCGFLFIRIRESYYYATTEKALEPLWKALEDRGIVPVTDEAFEEETETINGNDQQMQNETHEAYDDIEDEQKETEKLNNLKSKVKEISEKSKASVEGLPINMEDVFRMEPHILGTSIIEVLKGRTNNSCMRDNMHKYLLKNWGVRTRNAPMTEFKKMVNSQIAKMSRSGYLIIYKSVNERIKLGWKKFPY